MDTEKCAALLCALETGSVSAAAGRRGYTVSGMSRLLASLEEEMGFEFFYTFQKRQNLTDLGMAFYEKAVRVVSEYEGLMETAPPAFSRYCWTMGKPAPVPRM